MSRVLNFLSSISEISALPAHAMTYAVVLTWVAGACGFEPAARWWSINAGTVTTFVQLSLAIWLAARVGGKAIKNKGGECAEKDPSS